MTSGYTIAAELDLLLPITALLPLSAILLVNQNNPYQTLVLRGILGSISTLIYALLGAPDVALTEALVGTLLSTTIYAVALRSSMALRIAYPAGKSPSEHCQQALRSLLHPLHLRLRLVSYSLTEGKKANGFHGHLQSGDSLVIYNNHLHQRLTGLEGYQAFQDAGVKLKLNSNL